MSNTPDGRKSNGGARQRSGRAPSLDKDGATNVTLTSEERKIAAALGDGQIGQGIRRALRIADPRRTPTSLNGIDMDPLTELKALIGAPATAGLDVLWPGMRLDIAIQDFFTAYPDAGLTDALVREALMQLAQSEAATNPAKLTEDHWAALATIGVARPTSPSMTPPVFIVV